MLMFYVFAYFSELNVRKNVASQVADVPEVMAFAVFVKNIIKILGYTRIQLDTFCLHYSYFNLRSHR